MDIKKSTEQYMDNIDDTLLALEREYIDKGAAVLTLQSIFNKTGSIDVQAYALDAIDEILRSWYTLYMQLNMKSLETLAKEIELEILQKQIKVQDNQWPGVSLSTIIEVRVQSWLEAHAK